MEIDKQHGLVNTSANSYLGRNGDGVYPKYSILVYCVISTNVLSHL